METINEAVAQSVPSLADEITSKIATLETQIETLRNTLNNNRSNINALYSALNSNIEEGELKEDDSITYGDLSEIVESIFGNPLSFLKDYEADVEFTVRVVAKFKATDDSAARDIAENIELNIDADSVSWTGDGDDEISETWVDETTVRSVTEQ